MPESELETEPETAGSSHHLRKIDLEVPSLVEPIQNSTLTQGRWENVQGTWQHCQAIEMKTKPSSKTDASTLACNFPLIRLKGQNSSHNPLDSLRVQPLNYVHKFQPHRETRKGSDHTWKACPEAFTWIHVMMHIVELRTLWAVLKNGCCRGFQLGKESQKR